MATYFDTAVPALDGAMGSFPSADVPQLVSCLVCATSVRNLVGARDAHGQWHDMIAATAASAFGTATNGAMAASASVDVVVPLSKVMPTASYAAVAEVVAGTGSTLAGARVMGIVARTTTAVTVRVQNTGLAAIASSAFTVAVLVRGPLTT